MGIGADPQLPSGLLVHLAVHQCARFSDDPKHSHEVAAKRIVRYLKSTPDEGIILKPDKTQGLMHPLFPAPRSPIPAFLHLASHKT